MQKERRLKAALCVTTLLVTAYAVCGRPRDEAEKAVWDLWSQPRFALETFGIELTVGMCDHIINNCYDS